MSTAATHRISSVVEWQYTLVACPTLAHAQQTGFYVSLLKLHFITKKSVTQPVRQPVSLVR